MKRTLYYWFPVALFIGVMVWSFSTFWNSSYDGVSSSSDESENEKSDLDNPNDFFNDPGNIIQNSTKRSGLSREELVEKYPDDYFDMEKFGNKHYSDKVVRHYAIVDYIHSERKNDPSLHQIMIVLLENGYDIEEWGETVGALGFWQLDYQLHKKRFEDEGLIDTDEAVETLNELKLEMNKRYEIFQSDMESSGVDDPEVMKMLWEIDVGIITDNDGTRGLEKHVTVFGDRLNVDEDWMTREFEDAKKRYRGNKRPDRTTRIFNSLEARSNRFRKEQEERAKARENRTSHYDIIWHER